MCHCHCHCRCTRSVEGSVEIPLSCVGPWTPIFCCHTVFCSRRAEVDVLLVAHFEGTLSSTFVAPSHGSPFFVRAASGLHLWSRAQRPLPLLFRWSLNDRSHVAPCVPSSILVTLLRACSSRSRRTRWSSRCKRNS